MSEQSITVVRDWHPLRRAVAAGAMSVVLASAMALPAFAATGIDYNVGDQEYSETVAFNDEANGISWDGADAITIKDANLGFVDIDGDSVITLTGESTIAGIDTMGGDLTLVGDVDVPAEEKPILNLNNPYHETWIDTSIYTGEEWEAGDITIKGLTINLAVTGTWIEGGNITIDNSKLAVTDVDNSFAYVSADGTVDVVESVVDLGTGGRLHANDVLTIDNSDISVRASERDIEYMAETGSPFGAVNSLVDIVLKNEANGEIKYAEDNGITFAYVDTGDETAVFLKAASTPGYYTGKQAEAKAMPKTGDAVNAGVFAGMAALAAGALGALGLSRKRDQSGE